MHQEGLEPSAYRLEGGCSIRLSYWCTVNLHNLEIQTLAEYYFAERLSRRHLLDGAGDEIRTRDIQLGRLSLYQLSYSRNRQMSCTGSNR